MISFIFRIFSNKISGIARDYTAYSMKCLALSVKR